MTPLLPVLRLGGQGPAVSTLQTLLGIEVDGVFGPRTQKMLTSWQKVQGLTQDGICGPATWESLLSSPVVPYLAPCECPPGQVLAREGYRRQHGRDGQTWAIDLPTPPNTPLYAPCDGEVVRVSDAVSDPYNGTGIWIRPDVGPLTQIAMIHLSARAVVPGQQVARGHPIGKTGNTGASTGPHLHLEVAPELDPYALFRWAERGWL